MDRWSGAVSAVIHLLYRSVEKRKKVSISKSIYSMLPPSPIMVMNFWNEIPGTSGQNGFPLFGGWMRGTRSHG